MKGNTMNEPTAVEKLEAEAAAAMEQATALQAELDTAKADIEAKGAEIERLTADLAAATAKAEAATVELSEKGAALEKTQADLTAAETLATEAEARAKLAEGALRRDPDALKMLSLPGSAEALATALSTGGSEPQTWAEALEACKGEKEPYVAARIRFPKLFDAQFKN